MAENPFLAQLLGVNTSPYDTTYGQLSEAIGAATPRLVNPYASPGRNLASVAGAGLLAGLLGYQAKREAETQNRAVLPQLTALLGAKSPEEITALAGAETFPSRLVPFAQQTLLTRLQQQQSAAEKEAEFAAERQRAAINAYGQLAAARGTTEDQALLKALALGQSVPSANVSTSDQQQIAESKLEAPKPLLSPTEERQRRQDINAASEAIVNDRLTGAFKEAEAALKGARVLAERDDKVSTIALKKIGERALNPGNQVTMQELNAYKDIMPILEKYRTWFTSKTTGRSDLTIEARQQILAAIEAATDNLGAIYNERVTNKFKQLNQQGLVADINELAPFNIYIPQGQLKSEITDIVSALEQDRAATAVGRKGIDNALKAQLQQRLRELRERL